MTFCFLCQHAKALRTHSRTCAWAHTQMHKHMWTWLQSRGWLTNGTVFIFCLRHGGGNDSIIVLSAQHSLPISSQNSSAAGYPRLWIPHTHTHTVKKKRFSCDCGLQDECCTFPWVRRSHLLLRHLLHDPICYYFWKNVAEHVMGLIHRTRQLCDIAAMPVD